jgi:hypothetical protein
MVVKGLAITGAGANVNATEHLRGRAATATSAPDASAVASRSARLYDDE